MRFPILRARRQPFADPALRGEVLRGLLGEPKSLPPKLFYDERGARLFEEICRLPEYYLTRAELEILETRASEIAELAGERCALVEYGSGAGQKVRLLLNALASPVAYLPVDISREQLGRVSRALTRDYPALSVLPVCADYTRRFEVPRLAPEVRRLAFFPGSTIGNFHPAEAIAFLKRIRLFLGENGALLLGVDRRKDPSVLHAAYNDAQGVTAAFNLNLLTRLNREVGADFDLTRFRHVAFFNCAASRIEMHLESLCDQEIAVAGAHVSFARGETIWTESSYKYDCDTLETLVTAAGLEIARLWSDTRQRFWVAFLEPAPSDRSRGTCAAPH
jgi:dimethylhistidine N-methyltransferase